ncbi:UNVERIFIED_CONTAM: hypothetical protein GTU68_035993 [Idotea baltica]|nr:hypothetical protein [Idotea baltica]
MLTVLEAGDKILGFDLSHGGHLTHGSSVNFSGRYYKPSFYGVEKETGIVDMDKVEATALAEKPKLIICGASAYSRDWDYKRFREIADKIGALLLADVSHPAGLIATGILNNPLEHCHIVTTTTHKTLRGPRGGLIMMGKDFENPFGGVFPGTQGGPLEHVIAAKAVAFGEALKPSFKTYSQLVIDNAQAMAAEFVKRGYHLISKGTDNHCMLIDLSNKDISGKKAERVLGEADITLNKNMVPFDTRSPFITSGIRVGTPAITTRGLKSDEMVEIVDWMDQIITNPDDEALIKSIKEKVNAKMENLPLFAW